MFVTSVNKCVHGHIASLLKSHNNKQSSADLMQVFLLQPTDNSYQNSGKICESATGLRSHIREYDINVFANNRRLTCRTSDSAGKSEIGMTSNKCVNFLFYISYMKIYFGSAS